MVTYNTLSLDEKAALIKKEHFDNNMSINAMAKKYNTYPNRIFRDAAKLNIQTRTRSEAQKNALATGAVDHPMEGKTHSEETKNQIGDAKRQSWKELSDEEMKEISKQRKEQYKNQKNKPHESEKKFQEVKRASIEGSKLEKFLYEYLREEFIVQFHADQVLEDYSFHIDLLLPNDGIAIEVDGPGHYDNIWGEDKLAKTVEKDQRKTGLIVSKGWYLIRLKNDKTFSKALGREYGAKLTEMIHKIQRGEYTRKVLRCQ